MNKKQNDRAVEPPTADDKQIARSVANHIAAIGGTDLRHMTDDELVTRIKQSIKSMADVFSKFGITIADADKSFSRFSDEINK